MKTNFSKSAGRLRGKSRAFLLGLVLSVFAANAADSLYSNTGTIDGIPPNVNATNFYNSGTWNIFTSAPYETANTLNYTNIGTMTGSLGWEFDFGSSTMAHSFYGGPYLSANFYNGNGGTIEADDGDIPNPQNSQISTLASYLLICATNIVNNGTLIAGASGEIILSGANIKLSHSGLEITSISGGVGSNSPTNFVPDTAIYDEYWMATNNNLTVTGPWWNGKVLGSFQGTGVGEPCAVINGAIQIGPFTNSVGSMVIDSFTNELGPYTLTLTNSDGSMSPIIVYSNIVHQGVFVYTGSNGITGQIRFTPSSIPSNVFCTVAVQLALASTNVLTGQTQTNAFYIVDSFASSTNHVLNKNTLVNPAAACSAATYRPTAFVLSRTAPTAFLDGFTGYGVPPATFFYDPATFTNFVVTGGSVAAYSALVDNVAAQVPAGGSVSNLPGRVNIYAGNLNLGQTKVRAEGEILIQASNLTTSVNAAMDCQNLSYNLGSASGQLNFVNLAVPNVSRLQGTVDMYSAVWSNAMMVVYLNNYAPVVTNIGTSIITNYVLAPLTNFITVNLALTAVDASGLSSTVPVTVQDLILHSTNIVVTDSVTVDESFLLDGLSATLQGNVFLSGVVQNWTFANAPTLRYFTNYGTLFIPNNAHFGDDGPANYLAFVNDGFIYAGGQTIDSVYLQINNATNYAFSGGFSGVAQTAQLTGATIYSASDIQFFANTLQISQSTLSAGLSAGGALDFTVTNSLSDGGAGAGNIFVCQNGFNLWIKPATGGLLGTTINDVVSGQAEVDHVWAGQDFGATTTGYTNNAAIGDLILYPTGSQATGYEPLFAFYGATGGDGMYVNNLDLSLLADYANEIYIDPSLTIYFATAILNTNVNTGSQTAEQFLSSQFPGRLVWVGVTSLAKPKGNASTQKFQLTANYSAASGVLQLTENIMAGQTNIIEASTNLVNWVPVYTNIGTYSNFGPATIADPNATNYRARFYRFEVLP